jgi:hypothetical protein
MVCAHRLFQEEDMTVKELLAKTNPKFRDFMALKVGGKDEFSRLGYAALRSRMTPDDRAKVEEALEVHAPGSDRDGRFGRPRPPHPP